MTHLGTPDAVGGRSHHQSPDHPSVDADGNAGTVSNVLGSEAVPPWFLLDTSRSIKPLIWQEHEPYAFETLTFESIRTVNSCPGALRKKQAGENPLAVVPVRQPDVDFLGNGGVSTHNHEHRRHRMLLLLL